MQCIRAHICYFRRDREKKKTSRHACVDASTYITPVPGSECVLLLLLFFYFFFSFLCLLPSSPRFCYNIMHSPSCNTYERHQARTVIETINYYYMYVCQTRRLIITITVMPNTRLASVRTDDVRANILSLYTPRIHYISVVQLVRF